MFNNTLNINDSKILFKNIFLKHYEKLECSSNFSPDSVDELIKSVFLNKINTYYICTYGKGINLYSLTHKVLIFIYIAIVLILYFIMTNNYMNILDTHICAIITIYMVSVIDYFIYCLYIAIRRDKFNNKVYYFVVNRFIEKK